LKSREDLRFETFRLPSPFIGAGRKFRRNLLGSAATQAMWKRYEDDSSPFQE